MSHDQTPMTEDQWRRFMQESEAKAARYGDLFETLIDHPDRDALIAKEMGWDIPLDEAEDEAFEVPDDEPWEIDADEERRSFERNPKTVPAYTLAFDFGLQMMKSLKPYLKNIDPDASDDRAERLQSFLSNALIPAARIAGGHAMGYEPEFIGGNVVRCQNALDAARTAREDLRWLLANDVLPSAIFDPVVPRSDAVVLAIEEHLIMLRARMQQ